MNSFRYFLFHSKATKISLEKDANVTDIPDSIDGLGNSFHSQSNVLDRNTDGNDLQSSEAWTSGESLVGEKTVKPVGILSTLDLNAQTCSQTSASLLPSKHSRNEHVMR